MNIILATDGTKYGEAAADMLCRFNLKAGDEVKVLCVVDVAMPLAMDIYGGYLPDTNELEKAARENALRVVEVTVGKLRECFGGDVALSSDVLFGSPDGRIVETAEETGADLIIIGSHGYKRWERLLLGSVSDSVVHHAPCSVLVVRSGVTA
ncbi:MAG: universal stress protein [Pyrinomonadaceae bacterium]